MNDLSIPPQPATRWHPRSLPARALRRAFAVLAILAVMAGMSVYRADTNARAHATGEIGDWQGAFGLYLLSNGATGGPIEVGCIDYGKAAPLDEINTVKTTLAAPQAAYLYFTYTPGAGPVTRSALGFWTQTTPELPHANKSAPPGAQPAVVARYHELAFEAQQYAGPYTLDAAMEKAPTAESGSVKIVFTLKSAAGVAVPGVTIAGSKTGSATGITASSVKTNDSGRVAFTYSLENGKSGGIKATATGLAPTTVNVFHSNLGPDSGYQRVIGKAAPVQISTAGSVQRPEIPTGKVRLGKTSTVSGNFLPGAVLEIRSGSVNGPVVKTINTGGGWSGWVTLPVGKYFSVEKTSPVTYLKDAPPVAINLDEGDQVSVKMADSPMSRVRIVKVDGDNPNLKLPGVKFEIWRSGVLLDTGVTNAQGEYLSDWLPVPPGVNVKVVEVAAKPGYKKAEPVVTVTTRNGDGDGRVVVENYKIPRGRISIYKTDVNTNAPIAGTKFKVVKEGQVLASGVTGADGKWTSPLLETVLLGDKVKIVEDQPSPGYDKGPDHYAYVTTTGGGQGHVNITNTPTVVDAWIKIKKVDAATKLRIPDTDFTVEVQQQGQGPWLPVSGGTKAGTYANGVYTTQLDGKDYGLIAIDGGLSNPQVVAGDHVRATEVAAAPNYLLPLDPADLVVQGIVGVDGSLIVSAVNTPKRTIEVRKVNNITNKPLEGAGLVACYKPGARVFAPGEEAAFTPCVVPDGSAKTDQHGTALDLTQWHLLGELPLTGPDGIAQTVPSDWVRPGDQVMMAETTTVPEFSLSPTAAVTTVTTTGWAPECTNQPGGDAAQHEGTIIECQFANQPITQISLTKTIVDKETGEVKPEAVPAGAIFQITDTATNTVLVDATPPSDDFGHLTVSIPNLQIDQSLTFVETWAPDQAGLNSEPFIGVVTATETGGLAVIVTQKDFAPRIHTNLANPTTGEQFIPIDGGTMTDIISYEGLQPGREAEASGELMCIESDGVTVTASGIKGSTKFVPEIADGTVEVSFEVPADVCSHVVAYEWLTVNGKIAAEHTTSPPAPEQQGFKPSIHTKLVDASDGDKYLSDGGTVTDHLIAEGTWDRTRQYYAQGTLTHSAGTSEPITGGKRIDVETLLAGDASVDLVIPPHWFTAGGQFGWADERIYVVPKGAPKDWKPGPTDVPVAQHLGKTDKNQQIEFAAPGLETDLFDVLDEDQHVVDGSSLKDMLIGRGQYQPHRLYLAVGTFTNGTSSQQVTASQQVTGAEVMAGTAYVTFEVPPGFFTTPGEIGFANESIYLIPEDAPKNWTPPAGTPPTAEHKGEGNPRQTVTYSPPGIKTQLFNTLTNDQIIGTQQKVTLRDMLLPTGHFYPYRDYLLSGVITHETTGQKITGTTILTGEQIQSGKAYIDFDLPEGFFTADGETAYANEYLYLIPSDAPEDWIPPTDTPPAAQHLGKGIPEQTVTYDVPDTPAPPPYTRPLASTGVSGGTFTMIIIGSGLLMLGGLALLLARLRRRSTMSE